MSENEKKKKQVPRRFSWWKIATLGIIGVFGLIVILIVLGTLTVIWGGYIKPSLDPEFVPTAEYLIENPQPINDTDDYYLYIYEDRICIGFSSSGDVLTTQIYVNQQRIGLDNTEFSTFDRLMTSGIRNTEYCVPTETLESGLHLIEARDGDIQHTWAIEVE